MVAKKKKKGLSRGYKRGKNGLRGDRIRRIGKGGRKQFTSIRSYFGFGGRGDFIFPKVV